jgi:hypothetical protein
MNVDRRLGVIARATVIEVTVVLAICSMLPALAQAAATINLSASPTPTSTPTSPDALRPYGTSAMRPPYSRIYVFSVSCAAFPCKIRLTETASARRRRLRRLDRLNGPEIIMNPDPDGGLFAVWFQRSDFNQYLLASAVRRYGSVQLNAVAVLTDADGSRVTAGRRITLLPPKPKPGPQPVPPGSPPSNCRTAVTAYCAAQAVKQQVAGATDASCRRLSSNEFRCKWADEAGSQIFFAGTAMATRYPNGWNVVSKQTCDGNINGMNGYRACQLSDYP